MKLTPAQPRQIAAHWNIMPEPLTEKRQQRGSGHESPSQRETDLKPRAPRQAPQLRQAPQEEIDRKRIGRRQASEDEAGPRLSTLRQAPRRETDPRRGAPRRAAGQEKSQKRDILVIGGSAGALEALKELVRRLPPDLPASIFVVVHISNDAPSLLAQILDRAGPLPARQPANNEKIEKGVIYVAPPDFHMLLKDGRIEITRGPRENRHRPAIDPLFRSAARIYGNRVAGVVLSGMLDDGAAGLAAIKMRKGLAIVQDPLEAEHAQMPRSAAEVAGADCVLGVREIAALLARVATNSAKARDGAGKHLAENAMRNRAKHKNADKAELSTDANLDKEGKPSAFACPECHGVLWEVEEGQLLRFRCRVGHAYTAAALEAELSDSVEDALWAAMRVLQEKTALLRRVAQRFAGDTAARFQEQAQAYERHAEAVRAILVKNQHEEAAETIEAESTVRQRRQITRSPRNWAVARES